MLKKNANWIKQQGGYETGREHYFLLVALHILFFISLLLEVHFFERTIAAWAIIPSVLFLLAQAGRCWALLSLGRFWNTRIMILPHAKVVARGPYRYIRHPNYAVVMIEIIALPLIFQAYVTALVFTLLNGLVLSIRIKEEEKALKQATNYSQVFEGRRRFLPKYEK